MHSNDYIVVRIRHGAPEVRRFYGNGFDVVRIAALSCVVLQTRSICHAVLSGPLRKYFLLNVQDILKI